MMKFRLFIAFFLSTLCVSSWASVSPEEQEILGLLQEIEELEAQVKELEDFHEQHRQLQNSCGFSYSAASSSCILAQPLNTTDAITAVGGVKTSGAASFDGWYDTFSGNTVASGSGSIQTLEAHAKVTTTGDVNIDGSLDAGGAKLRGDAFFNGTVSGNHLDVRGRFRAKGFVRLQGDVTFDGNINVENHVTIDGECTLDGDIEFRGRVLFDGDETNFEGGLDLSDGGEIEFNDDVYFFLVEAGLLVVDGTCELRGGPCTRSSGTWSRNLGFLKELF